MATPEDKPLVIVGGSLAVLVAATERARLGLPTTIVSGAGGLGGYFAGLQVMGRRRDAGMVLYEFSAFSEASVPPALADYDPMRRNDVGRFCGVVRRYVRQRQRTRIIDAPLMWVEGAYLPDMMLGNGIRAVARLAAAPDIRCELLEIAARLRPDTALCHPANKRLWPVDGSAPADWATGHGRQGMPFDCDSVSRAVHGKRLHETLFLPFARQVMNRDASHLSALYHRLPWLPLYWPESLLAELDGSSASMPATVLSSADGESVADLCQRLIAAVRNNPLITLIQDQVRGIERDADGFRLTLADRGLLRAPRLGWALTPGQGLTATGLQASPPNDERLPLMLGFMTFREADVLRHHSFVHAVSAEVGAYRVTNSSLCGAPADAGTTNLVVEANPRHLAAVHGELRDEKAVLKAMLSDLVHMGMVREGAVPAFELKRFEGALPLPTHEAVAGFLDDRSRLLARCPGIELINASAAPFAMGLSDQIVQGLQLAARGLGDGADDMLLAGPEPAGARSHAVAA